MKDDLLLLSDFSSKIRLVAASCRDAVRASINDTWALLDAYNPAERALQSREHSDLAREGDPPSWQQRRLRTVILCNTTITGGHQSGLA
ncbi:hypothetical protein WJX73_001045 [Symbiochloris irregularis]|uniref:Uncharacterized protein n=1 Tax=Symbiochloris irregularis TaxID=706552 RepID=A0AAW1NNX0_9CHLO